MNRYFAEGTKLNISGKEGTFEIREMVGRGASCAVYHAEYVDVHGNRTEHLLKEYNPKYLELYREESGELCLDTENDRADFETGLVRFEQGYRKQLYIRREIANLKNVTSNVQDIYYANGTRYIDMTCNEGVTYDEVQEKSLFDLLRRIKALAQTIGYYHNAGMLHLDIKPQNIYAIPETCEMVLLFDFDSVVNKTDVPNSRMISYTKNWAAPEQLLCKRSLICEATDIFAIGEILFYQIYGRHSEMEERRSFAIYEFNHDLEIFKNVNPKVFELLSEIFHKTICGVVSNRYQSVNELVEILDKSIKLANPKEPYLKSSLPAVQNFFIGRDAEIEEIHQKLSRNNVLFVSGIGGIGKSELVKNYAKKYRSEYDAVIFAPYVSSIKMMICDDMAVPICNVQVEGQESQEDYFNRKMKQLKELCDENVLMIIDNYDNETDEMLEQVLGLGCKVLITTRMACEEFGFEQINILALRNSDDVRSLFQKYHEKQLAEEEMSHVQKIIEMVDSHTMIVELLAKQMLAGRVTPKKMLEKLQNGISKLGRERVRSRKDGALTTCNSYEHIKILFDISALNEEEIYVLANLAMIPVTGIPAELFCEWCECESYENLNELAVKGWLRWDKKADYISLHPMISETILAEVGDLQQRTEKLLCNSGMYIDSSSFGKELSTRRVEITTIVYGISNKLVRINLGGEITVFFLGNASSCICGYYGYREALRLGEISIKIADGLEKKPRAVSETYQKIGRLYYDLECYEKAEEYYLNALDVENNFNDELHEYELKSLYDNLGFVYLHKKNLEEASEYFLHAVNSTKKICNETSDKEIIFECQRFLVVMYEMLSWIYSSKNNLEEAERYSKMATELKKSMEVKEYDDILLDYIKSALLHRERREFEKSEHFFRKTLSLPADLEWEITDEVARAYYAAGDYCEEKEVFEWAEVFYSKSLDIKQLIYGETHSEVIKDCDSLRTIYERRGRLLEAEEYGIKYLELCRDKYGEYSAAVQRAYHELGVIYYELKNYSKAEFNWLEALKIGKEIYQENDMELEQTYNDLGVLYLLYQRYDESEEYYTKALKICMAHARENSTEIATVYNNLGVLYKEKGDVTNAKEYCIKGLNLFKEMHGDEGRNVATSYMALGGIYLANDELKCAEEVLLKSLNLWYELMGKENPFMEKAYLYLEAVYRKKGDIKRAEECKEKLMACVKL